jgi:PAS domain S-box-containing protein
LIAQEKKERPQSNGQQSTDEAFRQLVDGVKDYAIFLLDPQGKVVSWNQGAKRIKGYSANEIIGQHFSRFYPLEAIESRWPDRELEIAAREGRYSGKKGRLDVLGERGDHRASR